MREMLPEEMIEPPIYGVESAADLFDQFSIEGNKELSLLRHNIIKPEERKKARTWGIVEAASMVGASANTIRTRFPHLKDEATGKWVFTLNQIQEMRAALKTNYTRPAGSRAAIMAISNFKGGVGKTTTVVHLAQKAAIEGLRVLVVDLDPQASTTFNLGPFIPDMELTRDDIVNRAMLEDPELILELVIPSYFPGISLIPSNLHLQELDVELPKFDPSLSKNKKLSLPPFRLQKALDHVREHFDLILLDCGPNMASVSVNAMTAADSLIVPIPPSSYDHASFVMLCSSLANLFTSIDKSFSYLRLLITKHPGGNSKGAVLVENRIRRLYHRYVLSNVMHITTEIEKANAEMSTVYDQVAGKNNRRSYLRALEILDAVNNEVLDDLKAIWQKQADEANANG